MDKIDKGQLNQSAAEVYDTFFIPALFQEWPERLANAAQIQAGQQVLDVACGTGVLARTLAEKVGDDGVVIGLDINPEMLAVAERKSPLIEWKQGAAEDLPFEHNSFDAVVSQFGLMFFADRQKSIDEMVRVLRPGCHLAVAVWASLEDTPGYLAMVNLLTRLFGEEIANGIRMPYVLGDKAQLEGLFTHPHLENLTITTQLGTASFPSLEAWMYTDIKGWVLADRLDDAQFELLLQEAKQTLTPFVKPDGTVAFDAPAHIVSATKKTG